MTHLEPASAHAREPLPQRLYRCLLPGDDPASIASCERGTRTGSPTAWIISYTGVSDEPRVLRQAQALLEAGWQVVVAGFEGRSPRPTEWTFISLANRPRSRALPYRLALRLQYELGKILYIHARHVAPLARLGARLAYFSLANWRQNHFEVLRLAERLPDLEPDLIVAHDYHTVGPAHALARRFRAPWVIDAHEYARGQYMHDPEWVRDGRLFTTALQDYYFARADAVTTVCDGIADLLNAEQTLRRPVTTIRSVPSLQRQTFRPVGDTITVLYHGIIAEDRGLRRAIESMPLWRPEFRFVVRGDGPLAVADELRTLARRLGVANRLTIEPPVSFAEIVPAANKADIGYFAQEDISPQKRFTLPNKFFEYMMAGLALCVSDLPEMARLVRKHHLGVLVPEFTPDAIANAINGFTRERIESFKRASLAASEQLHWDAEKQVMLELFEELISNSDRP